MNIENERVSNRQIFRLYVFDLLGIATLLLPPYLAKLCGENGVFAICIGTAAGIGYLWYLGWIMAKMGMDMFRFLRTEVNTGVRFATYLWLMLHCLITAGFCGTIFANLMRYSLVKEESFGLILGIIILASVYAVAGGIESRARVYEVLFFFVLIPYVAMMLASVKDVQWEYLKGMGEQMVISTGLLEGAYLVFLLLTPLFFSLFLVGRVENRYGSNIVKNVTISILVSAAVLLGSYLLLVGNFGIKALGGMRYPVITIMSTVQFEGNFLKRMDALMLAVWFFTLFALLNLHLHYGTKMLQQLTAGCGKGKSKGWQGLVAGLVVFLLGYWMETDTRWMVLFLDYYSYVAVPILVLGPLFILASRRKRKT